MGCRNNIATFSIGNNSMDKHHVQPTFLERKGGGGGCVEPPKKILKKGGGGCVLSLKKKFSKRGWGLMGSQFLGTGCWERRG